MYGIGISAGLGCCPLPPAGLGPLYLVPAAASAALLIAQDVRLVREPTTASAWQLFHTSNLLLLAVLLAACVASTMQLLRPC